MEDIERIYILLLHSNGLKIKEIANSLSLDKFYVAEIMFSTDNIPYWYQDNSFLWFAKEGAIEVKEPEEDKFKKGPKRVTGNYLERHVYSETNKGLQGYLKKIFSYPNYSYSETNELFERYRNGDNKARDLIVKGNLKLVAGVARFFKHKGISYDELIQEGNLGLLNAIEQYDHTSDRSFNDYAKTQVYRYIYMSSLITPYLVTIPNRIVVNHQRLYRYLDKREQELEFEPPIIEAVEALLGTDDTSKYDCLPNDLLTITEGVDLDSFESNRPPADDSLMKESKSIYIKSLLSNLSRRAQIFVTKYYGIGCQEETLEQIAETYGLTRERVRQIVEKSRYKLQEILGLRKKEKKDHKTSTKSISSKKTTQTVQLIKSHANGNDLYSPFTTLQQLCIVGVLTRKECKQCHHKGLWTIGDVQKKIEKYNLTPESTRFTKYTLDMWFKIVALLDKREQNAKKVITLKPAPKPAPTSSTRIISDKTYMIYTQKIMKLYQSSKYGVVNVAKPVLLLAIIDGVGLCEFQYNRILLDERLEERYKSLMKIYNNFFVYRKITPINMPFWYLQTDGFWHLRIKGDKKIGAPTTNWLKENVLCAFLDEDLWIFLQNEMCRKLLRDFIIEHKLTTYNLK